MKSKVEGGKLLPKVSFQAAPMPAPVCRIVAGLVTPGLTGEHDPSAGLLHRNAVREAPRF
jgi:hypothetical protein